MWPHTKKIAKNKRKLIKKKKEKPRNLTLSPLSFPSFLPPVKKTFLTVDGNDFK